MTDDSDLIRLLLSSGAKPTISCFPRHLRDIPTDMAIKMFVVGNPGSGKSTFVKSLSTEGQGRLFQLKHQLTKVKDVDEKTAGIIPHDIYSIVFGHLSVYDFAGHKEYYAGHDALLHNTMKNSPSIVALVVNMKDNEGKLEETLRYWFQFIDNHTSEEGAKPHLLIIGSHVDELPSGAVKKRSRVLESVVCNHKFNSTTLGQIMIDCRFAESPSMTKIRSILSQICQSMGSSNKIASVHHSFLVFMLHRFGNDTAIKLSDAEEELRQKQKNDEHLKDLEYAYLECLKSANYMEVCENLSRRGHILFMKNKEDPENSWIVLDKAVLLSQVSGVIFAPEEFKEHQQNLSTSTGVVPASKLAPLFPNIDSHMITQFLCHLEFCREIKDIELVSLPATEEQSSLTAGERYFFFPGLVSLETPQNVIASSASDHIYNTGWMLQCSNPEQFFTSRFLEVLLLRLAFWFALSKTHSHTLNATDPTLHRKCSVWKNGIHWVNRSGGEAVVEVTNLRRVVVMIRSKTDKMELVKLRSSVVNTVNSAREEFCSKVVVSESLVLPEDATEYPLDPSKVTDVCITEVAETVAEGKKYIVDKRNQPIELEKLIQFEPYAYIGKPLLERLFNEMTTENQESTDELLSDIAAKRSPKNVTDFCTIFVQKIDDSTAHESTRGLSRVFQDWRNEMGKKGTEKCSRRC